jgi:hypothetical protein
MKTVAQRALAVGAHHAAIANPNWRWGQTLFNVAYELDREWADNMRGTLADPFHMNDRADEFILKWIEEH